MAKRGRRTSTRAKPRRGRATKRTRAAKRPVKSARPGRAKRTRATRLKPTARAKRPRSRTASKMAGIAKKAASEAVLTGIGTALGELKKEQTETTPEETGQKDEQK